MIGHVAHVWEWESSVREEVPQGRTLCKCMKRERGFVVTCGLRCHRHHERLSCMLDHMGMFESGGAV
jgi:hypothetical protein